MDENEVKVRAVHPSWFTKLMGFTNVVFALLILSVVAGGGYMGIKILQSQEKQAKEMDLVMSNLRVLHQQTVIRDIIEEKIGEKLNPETKSQVANEIYQVTNNRSIPPELALALAEKESGWIPTAVNNSSGATGLYQMLPSTAISQCKIKGMTFSMDRLRDPVANTIWALNMLADLHDGDVIAGRAKQEDWSKALFFYGDRSASYVPDVFRRATYYKKRLDNPFPSKEK